MLENDVFLPTNTLLKVSKKQTNVGEKSQKIKGDPQQFGSPSGGDNVYETMTFWLERSLAVEPTAHFGWLPIWPRPEVFRKAFVTWLELWRKEF